MSVSLWVGTRKGLFRAHGGERRADWRIDGPFLAGREVHHTAVDPTDPDVVWAATNHTVWGPHLFLGSDHGTAWQAVEPGPRFPETSEPAIAAIWHLAVRAGGPLAGLYAGVAPAALFRRDRSGEWTWLRSLEEHATRTSWQPAGGGLALHSIQFDTEEPETLYAAVSAGGCYRSRDGGASWRAINRGVRADYLADPASEAGHNPHSLRSHPALSGRLYRQGHTGVYRSDDGGDEWIEISAGLPSDFGYVVGLDPNDPDRCWVIPEESSHLRCVCEGRLRVYETRDAGASWVPGTRGLPQKDAYVSVLREALCTDGLTPCGVYFGTSTGQLFGSPDGESWEPIATYLPTILSVTVELR